MNQRDDFELERYELRADPRYTFAVGRRAFVQCVGAGIFIGTHAKLSFAQGRRSDRNIGGRLHIESDGAVTAFTSKVQVGQGSRTQISQAVAEELGVPLDDVRLIMADTAFVPNDGGTYGSQTTPRTIPDVREAAAAARELLIEMVADSWKVDASTVTLENGVFKSSGGQEISLAKFVRDIHESVNDAFEKAPNNGASIKSRTQWSILGTSPPPVHGREIVTGDHEYPSDIYRKGMVYAKVLRPPSYGAELVSVDVDAAKDMNDVRVVREGSFIGCTAPTSWQAKKAIEAIAETAEWKEQGDHPSSENLFEYLKTNEREGSGRSRSRVRDHGDFDGAIASAKEVIRAEYHIPYIQHAPMETRAAVAEWNDDELTVWTGTQRPFGVKSELADAFSIPSRKVRVIVPDTGGGFGGKHTGDAAVEAARLAKEVGKPVSLQWTREEEFIWAYFRPAGVIEVAASLDSDGKISGWEFINYNSGGSAIECPYKIENQRVGFKSTESPLRQGSYRALASTANNFAREAFFDRLARTLDRDPYGLRMEYLEDERLRRVLRAAAEQFGWEGRKRGDGVGYGIACGTEKNSVVAGCAEVHVSESGQYEIKRICTAFECGAVFNPKNLQSQIEGCVVMGLGAVLHEAMIFDSGKIRNNQFKLYEVPRFKDVPPMETVIVERPENGNIGAGETPIIAIAPSVANALLDATGNAREALPLV